MNFLSQVHHNAGYPVWKCRNSPTELNSLLHIGGTEGIRLRMDVG